MRHPVLRARAALYRLRWPLSLIASWLAVGVLVFHWRGDPWHEALLDALYLKVPNDPWAQGYAFWGQSLLFGVLVAFVVRESQENHAERCREMARHVKNHTIIIGYTHLGQRLVEHCMSKGIPYVLIEKNRDVVDDLVRLGEPVLVDDAKTKDALPSANIEHAKRVILACNNIETALLVTKRTREVNPTCQIIVRCADDELIEVVQGLGANNVFSVSQAAFQHIVPLLS